MNIKTGTLSSPLVDTTLRSNFDLSAIGRQHVVSVLRKTCRTPATRTIVFHSYDANLLYDAVRQDCYLNFGILAALGRIGVREGCGCGEGMHIFRAS